MARPCKTVLEETLQNNWFQNTASPGTEEPEAPPVKFVSRLHCLENALYLHRIASNL
jgi:hypothetical protein